MFPIKLNSYMYIFYLMVPQWKTYLSPCIEIVWAYLLSYFLPILSFGMIQEYVIKLYTYHVGVWAL